MNAIKIIFFIILSVLIVPIILAIGDGFLQLSVAFLWFWIWFSKELD